MSSYIKIAIKENDLAKINRGLGFAFTYVGAREKTTKAFYDYFYCKKGIDIIDKKAKKFCKRAIKKLMYVEKIEKYNQTNGKYKYVWSIHKTKARIVFELLYKELDEKHRTELFNNIYNVLLGYCKDIEKSGEEIIASPYVRDLEFKLGDPDYVEDRKYIKKILKELEKYNKILWERRAFTLNVNDWQTIQSRKEIQNIKKQIKTSKLFNCTIIIEIILVIMGFALDNIFSEKQFDLGWTIISIISILIPLSIFFVNTFIKISKKQHNKMVKDQHEIINLFDDEICYYVITAESLYDSLQNKINNSSSDKPTKVKIEAQLFYYIEISYYLNKSVSLISTMGNNIENLVASPNGSVIDRANIISFSRFQNTVLLINEIYNNLENISFDDKRLLETKEENRYYRKWLTRITKTINNEYGIDILNVNSAEG